MSRSTLVVLLTAAALAAPADAQQTLEDVADTLAARHVDSGALAGMAVGVRRGDETLLLKSYGFADLEWDVALPADAIFEIGSVTKQFTSAAMLQLWADGKIDLDADITEYLPEYDTQGRTIQLRRLFDHTSGIKGYTEMSEFGRIASRDLPRDSLVAMFEAEPLEFEPGTALIYNNSAYFLLGLIIEEVSGQSYEDYLEEHVFPRAGMDDTSYCTNDEVWERRAHGYQPVRGELRRASYIDHNWPYSAGSLCSTVEDLLDWNRALHGGEIVSEEAYAALTTPAPLEDGTSIRYAMGLSHHEAPSGRVIEHGGGIPGFLSHSRYYPDEDVTVVVLLNTAGPPGPTAIADALGEHLFGDDNVPTAGTFEGDLSMFEGRYRGPARGQSFTAVVEVEDGQLAISINAREAQRPEYLEGTTFFRGATRMTFDVEGGVATTLRMDQIGGHYVLARVEEGGEDEPLEVPADVLETYVGLYRATGQFEIDVTLEDGQLYTQAAGQGRYPVFADSETEFHLEVTEASIEFIREDGEVVAAVINQGGRTLRLERVEGS